MIGRARESRNPKKVIRVTLMESYGEIGRVPVNLDDTIIAGTVCRRKYACFAIFMQDICKAIRKGNRCFSRQIFSLPTILYDISLYQMDSGNSM